MVSRVANLLLVALVGYCPLACQLFAGQAPRETGAAAEVATGRCSCCGPAEAPREGEGNDGEPSESRDFPAGNSCQCFCGGAVLAKLTSISADDAEAPLVAAATFAAATFALKPVWAADCDASVPCSDWLNMGRVMRHLHCSLLC